MSTEYLLLLGFAGLTFGLAMFLIGMIQNMQLQKAAAKPAPAEAEETQRKDSVPVEHDQVQPMSAAPVSAPTTKPSSASQKVVAAQPDVQLETPPAASANASPPASLDAASPVQQVALSQPDDVSQPATASRPAAESGLGVALSLVALVATAVAGYRFESHRRQQRGRSA
jgi:DNA polymerase III gamma/tau subunit